MVALASAFVSLIPKTDEFRRTAERDLSASGASAGKGFGSSFGKHAMTNWKIESEPLVKEGGKTGERTGKRFSDGMGKGMGGLKSAIGGMVTAFGAFAAIDIFKQMIEGATDSIRVTRTTEAVIKSTGGAAHVSAAHVKELATSIGFQSASSGKAIRIAENLLLTFKGVRNEAGAGNKIFDQSTQAIVDMTAAMNHGEITNEGLKASTIQLGKALGDPVKGLTALTRIGVVFSEQQKKQIIQMVKAGNTLGAQKVILKEVQSEFGGAAKAAADPIKRLGIAWKSFETTVGLMLLPLLEKVAEWMTGRGMQAFTQLAGIIKSVGSAAGSVISGPMGKFFKFMQSGSVWAAALKGALLAMGAAIVTVRIATAAWAVVQAVLDTALFANPIGLIVLAIAGLVGALIAAYRSSATFRNIVNSAWQAIQNAAKIAWNILKIVFRGLQTAVSATINYFRSWGGVVQGTWSVIQIAARIAWPILQVIFKVIVFYVKLQIATFKLYWAIAKVVWAGLAAAARVAWILLQPIFVLIKIGIGILIVAFILWWRTQVFVWKAIGALIKLAWNAVIKPVWSLIMAGLEVLKGRFLTFLSIMRSIWGAISQVIHFAWFNAIQPIFNALQRGISVVGTAFNTGATAIGQAWARIKDLTKAPVNFVIGTVFNKGIIGLWDKVISWLHLPSSLKIGTIPLLEAGGRVPIGKYNRPTAIVGEGNPAHPEYVIPTDPKYRGRAASLWQAAGGDLNMLQAGGKIQMLQLGGILNKVKSVAGGIFNLGKDALGLITDPAGTLKRLFNAIPKPQDPGGATWQHAVAQVPPLIIGKAENFLSQIVSTFAGIFGGGGSGDGGKAVRYALDQLGKPYQWGATGPNSFDCSGLTWRAWLSAGKNIGRTTFQQINAGHAGSRATALPGDLHLPHTGHVMMFVKPRSGGGNEMIEAPHTGANVRMAGFRGGGWVRQVATALSGGAAGSGSNNTVFTSFWDPVTPMANGQRMNAGAIASSYIPLGSRIQVSIGGRSTSGTIEDLGPAKFVYDRWKGRPVFDLNELMMQQLTGVRSNTAFGSWRLLSAGSGRTLYGTSWRGFKEGGILGGLSSMMAGKPGVFDNGGYAQGWPFHSSKPEAVLSDSQWSAIRALAARGGRPQIGPINITGLPNIPSDRQVINGIDRVITMHGSYWR